MRVSLISTVLTASTLLVPAARSQPTPDEVDDLAAIGLKNRYAYDAANEDSRSRKCNSSTAAVRREW